MSLKIGEIIRLKAENRGLTQKSFGKLINKHEKTVANIYKRVNIDVRLLCRISGALEYDFFQHYYEEEPLKSLRQNEVKKLQDEIESLKANIDNQQQELKKQQKYIDSQEDRIQLMKEREAEYKTRKSE